MYICIEETKSYSNFIFSKWEPSGTGSALFLSDQSKKGGNIEIPIARGKFTFYDSEK